MYHRILVPLDGSEEAESILPCVAGMATGLKAGLVLLAVVDRRSAYLHTPSMASLPPGPSPVGASPLEDRAERYLKALAARHRLRADVTVRTGHPVLGILETQRECGCDLIALATRGTERLDQAIGETSLEILHRSEVPVLLFCPAPAVRDGGHPRRRESLGTLLVPVDGSPEAERVLPYVCDLAIGLGVEVRILYTVSLPYGEPLVKGAYAEGDPSPILRSLEGQAEEYSRELVNYLARKGVRATAMVVRGSTAENIRLLAEDSPSCTVVIAARGISGVGRMLLNDVADRVVRRTRVPVLVVPARGPRHRPIPCT